MIFLYFNYVLYILLKFFTPNIFLCIMISSSCRNIDKAMYRIVINIDKKRLLNLISCRKFEMFFLFSFSVCYSIDCKE